MNKRNFEDAHIEQLIEKIKTRPESVDKIRRGGSLMLTKYAGFTLYEAQWIYRAVTQGMTKDEFDAMEAK